jgi:UPF0176 protein
MGQPLFHIAFYQFAKVADVPGLVAILHRFAEGLLGSILVASEGINGMLAGTATELDSFEAHMRDPDLLCGAFSQMVFKRSSCVTAPFARLKIRAKREIVPLGIDGVDAPGRISDIKRADVPPAQWRELIKRDDVVVLDNRNSFEFRLGHFEGAVDPGVVNFRDFPEYVKAHAPQWKQDKIKVAMYCTGGIRCEKSSVWMQDLGLEVYQLEGGILNYFKHMPDAQADWRGECFVFDNRVALDTQLNETATTVETVYANEPDGPWRLARAQRLAQSASIDKDKRATEDEDGST